jgi:hypothetical protein
MLCLSGTNILHRVETVWKMMDEHTGQPRMVRTELKIQELATVVCAKHSQKVDEVTAAAAAAAAAAGISHGTCHTNLSDALHMSRVT